MTRAVENTVGDNAVSGVSDASGAADFSEVDFADVELGQSDDAGRVGALMAYLSRRVPLAMMAEVCGWDLSRASTAVAVFEQRLVGTGSRLLWFGDDELSVVPVMDQAPREQLPDLLRRNHPRAGMNRRTASMLHRVLTHQATGAEQANSDRVALGELINAGLVTYPAGERGDKPTLDPEVAFSLAL